MDKTPLTKDGEKKLQEELKNLKLERPEITKAIAEAREHGDLKENAEYHAAREQQSMVEARIKDIEFKLGNSEIIDSKSSENKNQIIFGSTVELLNSKDNSKNNVVSCAPDSSNALINSSGLINPTLLYSGVKGLCPKRFLVTCFKSTVGDCFPKSLIHS